MMQLTKKQKSEGWRIVKFGEIAKSVSKRVDPADTELGVYVGLEHLDPDNCMVCLFRFMSQLKIAIETAMNSRIWKARLEIGKSLALYSKNKQAVREIEGIGI